MIIYYQAKFMLKNDVKMIFTQYSFVTVYSVGKGIIV